jgi:hypothetical protein
MTLLIAGLFLMLLAAFPVHAQEGPPASPTPSPSSGDVEGIYDDPFATEYTDTATDSATPSATPEPRLYATSTADTPVAGSVETTLVLLIGGSFLMLLGFRFSRQ